MAKLEFREPQSEGEAAGYLTYKRVKSPYELYMEEEGIPVFRDIGVRDTRDLPLGKWQRVGGRGCFLHLRGIESLNGLYLVEVPAAGALNPERHMFDEFYLVIEGRGSTEVWREGARRPHVFEWQPGTLFMAPINTWHRLVNATSSPALVLAANNAPPIMNIYNSRSFVFDNPSDFHERFDSSADFFKAKTDVEAETVRGRAAVRSNVFPDIVNCELPLDNQRAPGYRRIQPYFHGYPATAGTGGFIAEYPSGRYSRPTTIMRTINYWGGPTPQGGAMGSDDGEEVRAWNIYGIDEGGMTIHYHQENEFVRGYYAERLSETRAQIQMPESLFAGPSEVGTYHLH